MDSDKYAFPSIVSDDALFDGSGGGNHKKRKSKNGKENGHSVDKVNTKHANSKNAGHNGNKKQKTTHKDVVVNKRKPYNNQDEDEDDDSDKQEIDDRYSHKKDNLAEYSEDEDDDDSERGGKNRKIKKNSFEALGLSAPVLAGVRKLGYRRLTPIQKQSLPISLSGKDIVAMARTGSGKTAAFLIPVVEKLGATHSSVIGARAIILSPTRELSQQTYNFAKQLTYTTSLRISLLQGGDQMEAQFEALSNNPDIIIATPGRLMHLLVEVSDFKLAKVQILVIDEADRMFEAGFSGQINEIMRNLPMERQTLLFSATMPRQVVEFSRAGLRNPEAIRLDTETKVSEHLRLGFFTVRSENDKLAVLNHMLSDVLCLTPPLSSSNSNSNNKKSLESNYHEKQQVVIFVATKHHVDLVNGSIMHCLAHLGGASVIYGSMDMESRRSSLDDFKSKRTKILIVTDVAARGIDIPLLDNVINFSFPASAKLFVHRVGRVARQGRDGVALSIVAPDELAFMFDIFLYLGRSPQFAPQSTSHINLIDLMPDNVWVGRYPQSIVDIENERARQEINSDAELLGIERSAYNAYRLYCRTRPEASKRSVQRAKELLNEPSITIHPLLRKFATVEDGPTSILGNGNANNLGAVEDALAALRSYRPEQTVLEVDTSVKATVKHSKLSLLGGSTASVMQKKRKMHQEAITKKKGFKPSNGDDEHHNQQQSQANDAEEENTSTNGDDDDDNDMAHSVISHQQPAENKRYLSKAERKQLKKLKNANGKAADVLLNQIKSKKSTDALLTSEGKKDPFKDEAFYISYEPSTYNMEAERLLSLDPNRNDEDETKAIRLEDAILDMTADEQDKMIQQKKLFRWDKKKHRYIRASLKDHAMSGRIKNESGAVVDLKGKKNRGKLYEKWQSRTKKRIGDERREEDGDGGEVTDPRRKAELTDVRKIAAMKRKRLHEETTIKKGKTVSFDDDIRDEAQIVNRLQEKRKKSGIDRQKKKQSSSKGKGKGKSNGKGKGKGKSGGKKR